MKKQLLFAVSLLLAVVFSSCNKDLTALDPSNFTCTPNPLEVKGGIVEATITGTFPVKYFAKNATVTVTPVLKFNGTEIKGAPTYFQGQKVKGNNQVIMYKAGGSYTIKTSFNYVPEMAKSELFLQFEVETSKKKYTLPDVKVADGVLATERLVTTNFGEAVEGPVIIADKFQKVIKEMQEADILFLIQQAQIRSGEAKSADMVALTNKIKELKGQTDKKVSGLEISGYASPDGSIDLNTNLAEKRQKTTADLVNSELKKVKASVTIDSKFTAEDWDGFQKLMEASTIQDKEVILRVLSMYSDPEQREKEIKNLASAFKSIADEVLPQLRRSRLKLTIDVVGKADSVITKLAKTDAVKLSVEELLYAATLTSSLSEKSSIYTKVTELYPSDVRGYNNLGVVAYQSNKLDDAARYFTKALEIDGRNADANFNAGLCALAKNDINKAEVYFGKAGDTKGNLSNALGTIYVLRGEYTKAKSAFGSTVSNNAAILQILLGNYNGARTTLSGTKPSALTSYLSAIVGARTNNREALFTNLKEAVKQDAAYKAKATTDLEFAKFFTDAEFIAIVQ